MSAAADPWLAGPEPPGPMHILFSFDGRVGRKTWWLYGVLAMFGLGAAGVARLRICKPPWLGSLPQWMSAPAIIA